MSSRVHRLLLVLVLGVYLLLTLAYGVVTPLFETPDEHMHYFTADFIARERRLPTISDPGLMRQEAAQPPLYYALASLIVRGVSAFDATVYDGAGQLWPNPKADPEDPRGENRATPPINVNMFIHGPAEAWPWRGYALAAHLARALSALFGLGTLLCLYGAGRTVWPNAPDRALLAVTLVAFLPQFAFLHGAVTNDVAVTFFCAAAIWQLLRITNYELRMTNEERRDVAGKSSLVPRISHLVSGRGAYLLLGVTIGLAMLSKTAGLLLLLFCVAVVAAHTWWRQNTLSPTLSRGEREPPVPLPPGGVRGGSAGRLLRAAGAAALVAGPALLLGGWLLWRNWVLYGDPTAANQFVLMAGGERPYTLRQVGHDMDRVWTSLFARFGWMNVQSPRWVYGVWSAIAGAAVLGGLGGVVGGWRGRRPRLSLNWLFHPAVLLAGWFALVAVAWLQFMLQTPADQGRLFYPALTTMALGAAYGLSRWPRPWTQLAAVGLALLTSVYSLAVVIPTAYAPASVVAAAPEGVSSLGIVFPEGFELVAATVDTPVVRVGDWLWQTQYWRALPGHIDWAPLATFELFGRDFHRIGYQVGYHGRGNSPATLWPEGALVADRMGVRVADDAPAPVEAHLTLRLTEEGERRDVGTVKVIPAAWPEPAAPVATLGEGIQLGAAELSTTSAAPGDTVEVRLRWQVAAPPGPDLLHLFVHLGDPTQAPLAQTDGPVMGGQYPSRLWAVGEVFDETVSLTLPADLPPGEYPVSIGLYHFDSGQRLPVTVYGQRQPTDAFNLGQLQIGR